MSDMQFPPLFRGEALSGSADPTERATQLAVAGTQAGLVVYRINALALRAAIVFAPETPAEEALTVLAACGVGFQNALGSLAPPEVAIHLEWPGDIRVNGARCGKLSVRCSTDDAEAEPDWLIVSLHLDLAHDRKNPGDDPTRTALMEEGCAEVDPSALLEAWVRHTLYWINRLAEDGNAPLHAEWRALAHDIGEDVDWGFAKGTFVGLDEDFGALLRDGSDTRLVPLSTLLT